MLACRKPCFAAAVVIAALTLATGCDPAPTPDAPADQAVPELVVAEDRLGAVTLADVDRFILELQPGQRWQSDVEPEEWYASIARRLAVERLLFDEAVLAGADREPRFQTRQRRIERQAYSDHYLATLSKEGELAEEPLGEAELRAFYDQHRQERYDRPEQRQVLHIFKRFGTGSDRETVLAELGELRQRVVAGESFAQLAREHSDSESRHQDGLLGLVERGHFPADFDDVVFALEEETPSDPIPTRDGGHLFFVARVFEAQSFAFEEMRRAIYQELADERRRQRLARAAADLPLPEDRFTPGPEEIASILRLGDRSAVLLRLDDFRLSIEEFQEVLLDRRRQLGPKHSPGLPLQLIEEISQREIIYQHLRRDGLPEIPQEEIERRRQGELVEYYARRKMATHLERQPERIRQHYEGNALRFSTPVQAGLTRLAIPLHGDAPALMAGLETARAELDGGRLTLADLAERHGGQVQELGSVTAAQLQASDPRALRFAFRLDPGEHSPPYQLKGALAMFRVDSRQEPEPRPLATVWDQVVQDYLTNYSPQLFEEVSEQLLEEAGFRLYSERLTSLGPMLGS